MRSRASSEKTTLVAPPALLATRRRVIALTAAALGAALVGGCRSGDDRSAIDISGNSPALEFTLTRASDGKRVTEADYRGRIVMLYFGYTFCPDVCPTTLANVADILKRLGPDAERVRLLFVTVDPDRDTLPVLADYVKNFAPADRRIARRSRSDRRARAPLPRRLFRHARNREAPLRGDARLGHLCFRRRGRGAPAHSLARLHGGRRRWRHGRSQASGRGR